MNGLYRELHSVCLHRIINRIILAATLLQCYKEVRMTVPLFKEINSPD